MAAYGNIGNERPRAGQSLWGRSRPGGIPNECDPALYTTSTIQMLPSGWITR